MNLSVSYLLQIDTQPSSFLPYALFSLLKTPKHVLVLISFDLNNHCCGKSGIAIGILIVKMRKLRPEDVLICE